MIDEWVNEATRYAKGKVFLRNICCDMATGNVTDGLIKEFFEYLKNSGPISGVELPVPTYEFLVESFISDKLRGPVGSCVPNGQRWPHLLGNDYVMNISLVDIYVFPILFKLDFVNVRQFTSAIDWIKQLNSQDKLMASRVKTEVLRSSKPIAWLSTPSDLMFDEEFTKTTLDTDQLRSILGIPMWGEEGCPCAFIIPVREVESLLRKPSVFEAGMNYVFKSHKGSDYFGQTVDLTTYSGGVRELVSAPISLDLVEKIIPLDSSNKTSEVDWDRLSSAFRVDHASQIQEKYTELTV